MQVTEQFVFENKHLSNTDIAKKWIKEKDLDPFKAEKYRHQVRRIRERIPQEEVTNTKRSILVIGDLHLPYTNEKYLSFNVDLKKKFNVTDVVFIGDIIDNQAISYHEHNPNLASAGDELKKAKLLLKEWYREFPNAIVMRGNHDLFDRKIFSSGLPKEVLREMSDILEVPNWKFKDEYVIDDCYFNHGIKINRNTIKEKAFRIQKNVICGHLHTLSYVEHISQEFFVSHIGCGVDFSSDAFNYAKGGSKEPIMSSLIIFEGQPILIKM